MELRPEVNEETIHVMFGGDVLGRGNGKCKGPEVRGCLAWRRNRRPLWLGRGA